MHESLDGELRAAHRALSGLRSPLMGLTDEETDALDVVQNLIARVFDDDRVPGQAEVVLQ